MKNTCTPPPQGVTSLKGFKTAIVMLFISAISLAQPGQKWATGGNSNGPGDFLGTTNNFSLDFKTNNTLKMVLGADGTLKVINLAGNGARMLQADATGKIIAFPAGNATDVLYGNGTWGSLPVTPTSWNIVGNNIVAVTTGNVGIGTNSPQYKLHVVGDAYISNNLFVGGGIIVTDQLKAAEYVTTGRLTADTIKMGAGRVIDGTTKVAGDLYIDPTRTLTAGGDIMANSKLTVAGNATFNGTLKATQGIDVGNNFTLKAYQSTTPGVGSILSLNSPFLGGGLDPEPPACVVGGTTTNWIAAANAGFYSTAALTGTNQAWLTMAASTTGDSHIDASGGIAGNVAILRINEKCFSTTNINTNGGMVNLGSTRVLSLLTVGTQINSNGSGRINILNAGVGNAVAVYVPNVSNGGGASVNAYVVTDNSNTFFKVKGDGKTQIGYEGTTPNDVSNTMLNLNVTSTQKPFEIYNTTTAKPVFKIEANGKTQIGSQTQATGTTHANALFTVYGKAVATEVIVTQQNWADFVFNTDYPLPKLKDVEGFYKKNKHLMDIPSEQEVIKNGISLGEMNKLLLKKIEENTIYIVEQDKKIQQMQQAIDEIKKVIAK